MTWQVEGVAGKSSWLLLFPPSACPPITSGYGESRAPVLCVTLVGPQKKQKQEMTGNSRSPHYREAGS